MRAEAGPAPAGTSTPGDNGWVRWQAWWVDRLKRQALRQLHASPAGERLLLRMYLTGEEATGHALRRERLPGRPEWLVRQMDRHLAEEAGHARAFATALAARGGSAVARRDRPAARPDRPDRLSRRKIARWHAVALHHAPRFESGLLVPAFAIGLCAEEMAARVLRRHCEVIGERHALHPLLAGVLADETRHVRLCIGTLERLVAAHERAALETLLSEVRVIDRSWGVTGALAMLGAGLLLRCARPGRRR